MIPAKAILTYLTLAVAAVLGIFSILLFGLFLAGRSYTAIEFSYGTTGLLAWDALLCLVFFAQHSIMIRTAFREWLTAVVPRHFHRTLYTAASGTVLFGFVLLWQHSDQAVWSLQHIPRWMARGVFGLSLLGLWWGYRALRSVDLLGMGPVLEHIGAAPRPAAPLAIRGPYRWVRHPMYFLILLLIWCCPDVTVDRLLFSALFTVWMVVGTLLEERDLVAEFGETYSDYQRQVPMLVPWKLHKPFRSEGPSRVQR